MHGDGCNQTVYKWSVRTATENNKGKRTMELPRENNRVSVQGRSQNRVGLMVICCRGDEAQRGKGRQGGGGGEDDVGGGRAHGADARSNARYLARRDKY